jgi:aminoglycoside phosphotransferase (APT) family kinase protein
MMLIPMSISIEEAQRLVAALLGEEDWRCRSFGAGRFSETFSISSRGSDEYVLRVAPPDSVLQLFYEYRMMRQEPALHQRLLKETSVPVPEIVASDFSRSLINRDFLIMSRLSGVPLSTARLSRGNYEKALREWGGYVAQIHSLCEPDNRFGYVGEHNCMTSRASWRHAFLTMFRKELEDIRACGVYTQGMVEDAIALIEDHASCFDNCQTSRLCHGDLWVTNLLVDDGGGVTGVIDFDRACWGDIEWDLAIAEYCGVTRSAFWEGYGGRVNTTSEAAATRRLFYLLYEHQKYIVISMSSRRNDPHGAQRYSAECIAIMENFRRTGQPLF